MAQNYQFISAEMFESDDETELGEVRGADKDDGEETVLVKKASGMVDNVIDVENVNTTADME